MSFREMLHAIGVRYASMISEAMFVNSLEGASAQQAESLFVAARFDPASQDHQPQSAAGSPPVRDGTCQGR